MLARSGYVVREIAGEYLLIPVYMEGGTQPQMAIVNDVGRFIWECLQTEQSVEDLLCAVTDIYAVAKEKARTDICDFLDYLTKYNLLVNLEERK